MKKGLIITGSILALAATTFLLIRVKQHNSVILEGYDALKKQVDYSYKGQRKTEDLSFHTSMVIGKYTIESVLYAGSVVGVELKKNGKVIDQLGKKL